jgi:hypothetical protein
MKDKVAWGVDMSPELESEQPGEQRLLECKMLMLGI